MLDFDMLEAHQIARDIASGKASARETVQACINRIQDTHAPINAVIVPRFEEALKEADLADAARTRGDARGLLHGVPITIKESFDVTGTPTTAGLTNRTNHRAATDAAIVSRLRNAGAIVVGKTNVSQLLLHDSCSNPLYGCTKNPWHSERSPGASSGGEAAILALGGSALGFGSDIGGSVRLPAHACGLNAFKPTSGKVSLDGHISFFPRQEALMCQPGPITRSMADLKPAMHVLTGEAFPPEEPLNLRVGFYIDNGVVRPSPSIRRAVSSAAHALEDHGIAVEEWKPPNVNLMWSVYMAFFLADGLASARESCRGSRLSPNLRQTLQFARLPKNAFPIVSGLLRLAGLSAWAEKLKYCAEDYDRLAGRRLSLCKEFMRAMDQAQINAILCPVFHVPALRHHVSPFIDEGLSYTSIYNFLGMPAGVVAATRVTQGDESDRSRGFDLVERAARQVEQASASLPVGVQVVARPWREDIAIHVMSVLEGHFRTQSGYPDLPPTVYR
jgi:Asp-tRNA(Asn)/Glu-tRNA(Gln) amidotransferase A subunit family amidase